MLIVRYNMQFNNFFIALLFVSVSINIHAQSQLKKPPVYLDTSYSFEERAADLVSKMTLKEEVEELHTNNSPAIPRLGVHQYIYWSEGQHGINAMFGNLHNGSTDLHRQPVDSPYATSFPTNFASTMSWDPGLIYRETVAISDEARGMLDKSLFGVAQNDIGESRDDYGNLTYWAPTVNMDRDPRWGRTDEAFGEDPFLASCMAAAFVNGFQGQNMDGTPQTKYLKVAATAKHFALNNIENNRMGISSDVDDEAIRDYYTATFKSLIENAHVAGLMTSYNAVNGTPMTASTYMVNVLGQRTYGFRGYITSDCEAIGTTYKLFPDGHNWAAPGWQTDQKGNKAKWINKQTGLSVSGAAAGQAFAVRAGSYLNCPGEEYTFPYAEEAINAGVLSKDVIDRALTRVFTIRMRTGEFDPLGDVPYTKITKEVVESKEHQALAEEVAENSLVLLKNDTVFSLNKSLLPLNANDINKVVIVGDLANKVTLGGYSGKPTYTVNTVEGIIDLLKSENPNAEVIFDDVQTSSTGESPAVLNDKTKNDIKSADLVIVFVGTNLSNAHEGYDRPDLFMPGNYTSLIYQVSQLNNPKMVLAIQSAGPIKINDIQHLFPSIVFSGYNGESQGTALASVLFGKKNPSGHLNFTWYNDDSQLPDKSNYYLTPSKTNGLGRTYMYFTRRPTYPFGFGLSYSKFRYSNFSLSKKTISPNDSIVVNFDVTNISNISGATVSQLYVASPKVNDKELPNKRLKGFEKTKMLDAGQSQHISLTIKAADLGFWDEDSLRNIVYNGQYLILLGTNSRDIISSDTINIKGTLLPKVQYVTIQPEKLIYKVGDTIELSGKNKWIKSDINTDLEQKHFQADNIIEAVNNDGSFINLANTKIKYNTNNSSVVLIKSNGQIKAVKEGVATIFATINGVSGSTVVVVKK